ncbi:MAG TPA: acyl carrier protein [Candidatus Saccharimonadia bacterium]|nr:acyl carrier protein [Candidatus Saccharimonadia bacterium]
MTAITPAELETRFEAVLRPRLRLLPPDQPLDYTEKLGKLGLDSMAAIDLLMELEGQIGAPIPDEHLTAETFSTAENLLGMLKKLVNGDAN